MGLDTRLVVVSDKPGQTSTNQDQAGHAAVTTDQRSMSNVGYSISAAVKRTQSPPYATRYDELTCSIPAARKWLEEYVSEGSINGAALDLSQVCFSLNRSPWLTRKGVPSGGPHPILMKALSDSIQEEESYKYGPILGNPSLRSAVADDIASAYRISANGPSVDDIAITTGCNMAFMALMQTICVTGDEVMLPTPSYFSHTMTVDMLALGSIYLPATPATNFIPTVKSTNAAGLITDKTKAVILVTPNNPTGAIYPDEVLQEWFEFARDHGIALVLDETYRDFIINRDHPEERARPHRLYANEDWRRTLVSLCSFSSELAAILALIPESYRLPGHRLGSVIGAPEMLQSLNIVLDCMQICAPRTAQLALAKAIPQLQQDLLISARALDSRMKHFKQQIEALEGWKVVSSGESSPRLRLMPRRVLCVRRKSGSRTVIRGFRQRFGDAIWTAHFTSHLLCATWTAGRGQVASVSSFDCRKH
jgi:aspartate/methionine/tyrosine aminotransferase